MKRKAKAEVNKVNNLIVDYKRTSANYALTLRYIKANINYNDGINSVILVKIP